MWANKRTRRVCLTVTSTELLKFDETRKAFSKKFKNLKYFAVSNHITDEYGVNYKIFLQFSDTVYMSTLTKFVQLINGAISYSEYDEPYDLKYSWGEFVYRGTGNKLREAIPAGKSASLSTTSVSVPTTELEKKLDIENKLLKELLQNRQSNNITINNNTVNVIINNYNDETYFHIDADHLKELVTPFAKQWNCEAFLKLTSAWGNAVYSNPANRNIKCRRKDGTAQAFIDGKWVKLPRQEVTIDTFNKLTASLKQHGSELFDNCTLTDTDVMLQCVVTGDSLDLQDKAYNRKKDVAVCEIMEQQK